MSWSSTKLLRHINMTKYWNRLINMNDDRLTKTLFLYDKSQCKNNIKRLCNSIGMSDKFNTLIEINLIYIYLAVKLSKRNLQKIACNTK